MQQLLAEGSYFSEEEMRKRAPWLFDSMVGKYQSDEEVAARVTACQDGTWAQQLLGHLDSQYARYGRAGIVGLALALIGCACGQQLSLELRG